MLIIEPRNSYTSGGKSGMFVPLPERNSSGCRLTWTARRRSRTSDQKPGAVRQALDLGLRVPRHRALLEELGEHPGDVGPVPEVDVAEVDLVDAQVGRGGLGHRQLTSQ